MNKDIPWHYGAVAPKGYRRIIHGKKRASDKFLNMYTKKFMRYDKRKGDGDLIGGEIIPSNFVVRKKS